MKGTLAVFWMFSLFLAFTFGDVVGTKNMQTQAVTLNYGYYINERFVWDITFSPYFTNGSNNTK